jgi:hypothetical protein
MFVDNFDRIVNPIN